MFYATHDCDGGRISQNSDIRAFETAEQARSYLLSPFSAADWDLDTAEIGPGYFGDCWIVVHSAPCENERYFKPFARNQLNITGPGQHPGGRAWWIEPAEPVLVIDYILEREEGSK